MRRTSIQRWSRYKPAQPGQVLLLAVVVLAVVFGLVGAFVSYLGGVRKSTKVYTARADARQAAQAGIDKAVWCLNQSEDSYCGGTSGLKFIGETGVQVGPETYYTTTVTSGSASQKTVSSTGYFPSVDNPITTVTLKADASISTTGASFNYGVQAGAGGFELENNAYVVGNIYSNGSVIGGNGSYLTGSVWVAGGTELTADQEQNNNTEDYTFGQTSPDLDIAQSFKISADNVVNKVSFYLKKVGSPSDVTVRILADSSGTPSTTELGSATLSSSLVTSSFSWVDVNFSDPPPLIGGETYWLVIDAKASASKYWIIGSLANNGYGNGIGMYSSDWDDDPWNDAGRDFTFKIWLGGIATEVDGVEVQENAHANTIEDSDIAGDAYYQTITNTVVGGTEYPGSPDPGPEDLPISDGQVDQWAAEAEAGGTIVGDYLISGTETLGPKKITGNLTIDGGASLTIDGTIYAEGDITVNNNAIISLSSAYGETSGIIMADGQINISNNVQFFGSGTPGSYVLVLTTNPSLDELSPAMDINNNSANSIFYASNGVITIANNASLKEVTGFKLYLKENAYVEYESGLANVNFSSGPGGSWVLRTGSQREVR